MSAETVPNQSEPNGFAAEGNAPRGVCQLAGSDSDAVDEAPTEASPPANTRASSTHIANLAHALLRESSMIPSPPNKVHHSPGPTADRCSHIYILPYDIYRALTPSRSRGSRVGSWNPGPLPLTFLLNDQVW